MSLGGKIKDKIQEVDPGDRLRSEGGINSYRQDIANKIAEGILEWFDESVRFGGTLLGTETPPPPASPIPYTDSISGLKLQVGMIQGLGGMIFANMNGGVSGTWSFIYVPVQSLFPPVQLDIVGKTTSGGALITTAVSSLVIPPTAPVFSGSDFDSSWEDIGNKFKTWVQSWTCQITVIGVRGANLVNASGVFVPNVS